MRGRLCERTEGERNAKTRFLNWTRALFELRDTPRRVLCSRSRRGVARGPQNACADFARHASGCVFAFSRQGHIQPRRVLVPDGHSFTGPRYLASPRISSTSFVAEEARRQTLTRPRYALTQLRTFFCEVPPSEDADAMSWHRAIPLPIMRVCALAPRHVLLPPRSVRTPLTAVQLLSA